MLRCVPSRECVRCCTGVGKRLGEVRAAQRAVLLRAEELKRLHSRDHGANGAELCGILACLTLALLPSSAGQRSQTACADIEATVLTVNHHALALDIGPKLALGRTLRVTHTMPEHRAFTTYFTLCHNPPLFFDDQVIIPQRWEEAT